jgi:hypothetical protein
MNSQLNNFSNNSSGIAYAVMKWGLLAYTAWRSFDLLSSTMGDEKMFAIFGLIGLDLGVLIWAHLYEHKARGHQAELSAILTGLDLIGVAVMVLADTVRHSVLAEQYNGFISMAAVWISASIIILNVAGGVIYPMLSPDAAARRRAKQADDEYEEKRRIGEHNLKLAELNLQNARLQSQARKLDQTATLILGEPFKPAADAPATQLAKDGYMMPVLADEFSNMSAEEMRERLRSLKNGGLGIPK